MHLNKKEKEKHERKEPRERKRPVDGASVHRSHPHAHKHADKHLYRLNSINQCN